jgi:hypothetical protein
MNSSKNLTVWRKERVGSLESDYGLVWVRSDKGREKEMD